jgi:hypothetical protein
MKSKTNLMQDLKERAGTTPGALAIAAFVGLASFILSRKVLNRRTLSSAIEASTVAATTFRALHHASADRDSSLRDSYGGKGQDNRVLTPQNV